MSDSPKRNSPVAHSSASLFVSVVIPAMNEEGNINELCRLLDEMFQGADFPGEAVIVNDGSSDATLARLEECVQKYPWLVYRSHSRNRGLTAALLTAFSAAKGNVFVFYPADLQFFPEDIPAMIAKIREGADVVTGWKQGKYNKRLVSSIYNWLSRAIFNIKVHDLNSVKAFRAEVVERLFLRRDWHRYLVVMAAHAGYVVDEVKVTLHPRAWGESKFQSIWRIPIGVMDMLAVKVQMDLLKKPLMVFGTIGAVALLFAFLTGVWALYQRYVLGAGHREWLFLIVFLTSAGLGLFVLGILAEALAGVREEVSATRELLQKEKNPPSDRRE